MRESGATAAERVGYAGLCIACLARRDLFRKANKEEVVEGLREGGDDVASDQACREKAQRVDVLRDGGTRTRASALVRRTTE